MKVAILIPTLDRPSFVKLAVLYYESVKSPHPIYIGDASNTEISENLLIFLKNIRNVKVRYFHWEGLGLNQTHQKLAKEASSECSFCVYQGDEDYFIPFSLTKGAVFLSENPDYRTAQGRAALVAMDSPDPVGNIKWIEEYWGINSLEESSRIERLLSFNKKYFVTQFSVHRVNEYISDTFDAVSMSNILYGEMLHSYTYAIKGKSKFIDCLYLIRVRHPDLSLSSSGDYIVDHFESIFRENWFHDYNKMLDSLSHALCDDGKISFLEAKKIISDMMKEILQRGISSQITKNKDDKKILYEKLKNIIPGYLRNKLKLMKNRLLNKEMSLLMTKHSRFHSDFLPVENSLTGKRLRNDKKLI